MTAQAASTTAPGWYKDKRWPGEQRRWDGARWLDQWRPESLPTGSGPIAWIVMGLVSGVLLGMLAVVGFEIDRTAGLILLWAASALSGVVVTIGIIAKGVEVGIRSARGH